MPELAKPVPYNIPLLQQTFQPAPVGPLAVDQRGLAKGALWGSIAQAIASLPKTLIDSYKEGQQIRRDTAKEKDRVLAEQQKRDREAMLAQKMQEASIPSAVSVESPTNAALGVPTGTVGGITAGKPALSDFTVSPSGITYNPEDPELRKAKADYYEARALADFGKQKDEGLTFANAQAAREAGYDPEGAVIHRDGTITVSKFKPSGIDVKGRSKLTDAQKTKLDSAAQLAAQIDGLMEDYDTMQAEHMAGPVLGNVEKLKQRFGLGSEVGSRIQAEMNTSLFRIARMLNGAGVLTDKDIARAEGVAPTITMGRDQFKGQLDAVKSVIRQGLETWKQTNAGQATDEQVALADKAIASLSGATKAEVQTSEAKPTKEAPATKTDPNGNVHVMSPDGKPGWIPAAQLKAAEEKGYKLIE